MHHDETDVSTTSADCVSFIESCGLLSHGAVTWCSTAVECNEHAVVGLMPGRLGNLNVDYRRLSLNCLSPEQEQMPIGRHNKYPV